MLFSSHQLELVEDICEDVAIVDHGRVVAAGTSVRSSARRNTGRSRSSSSALRPIGCRTCRTSSWRGGATASCRFTADASVDPQQVLAEAEQTAEVAGFTYGPPTLSELFLELVAG